MMDSARGNTALRAGLAGAMLLASLSGLFGCTATQRSSPSESQLDSPGTFAPTPGEPSSAAFPLASPGPSSADRKDTLPWSLVEVQGRRLLIASSTQKCESPLGAVVTEKPSEVTITVISRQRESPCTQQKTTLRGWIQLNQPLDSRRLIDGVDGSSVR